MAAEAIAVEVRGLTRVYGKFVAVDHIDLSVGAGEIFGFLGPNGAGKSTTIKMLCGLLAPTSGTARVGGFDVSREARKVRETIGYMSQKFSLYEDLRVDENLRFFGGIQNLDGAHLRARMGWAIEAGRLGGFSREMTRNLAAGVRQRLALVCAMIHEPRIMFLDEPTAGVDPTSRRDFWELIHHLSAEGVTVFVSTHYMDEAEHCDRLALIHRGKVVASGSPRQVKAHTMRNAVLEVDTSDLLRTLELASGIGAIVDVTLFGNRLHVLARDPAEAEAEMRRHAAEAGIRIGRIEEITPSLEDVFVSLLED